ncbi:pyridoxal phosphate-dependent aminotransferase [Sporosarcina sp. Marseille-Q4063]|uniref:MalY/PatB family protein n=1 Tax=Sporosarcina sp. Marseille-Q4063 TaxID=2810514 RepID=UPI001BB04863|nr:MalY/PatB family protein [Sporosarcina sp. Marseille-Q4063]QUW23234.1 pyridoxal phosphate-dependent aminotransferase [Sporosarcina sp. Marseille-Q4063]
MSIFEEFIDRRETRSIKWDRLEEVYGIENASNILPMWIADMDFAAPQVVIDAMQEVLDHGVFGYSYICDECKDGIQSWLEQRHSWKTENEWMLFHHGVVPAIATVIETFTEDGDGILITPPVYPPFFQVPELMERTIVECVMIEKDRNYSIDFVEFEKALQQNVKLFILCNPHNPGGIVWTEEELIKMIELCAKYDVFILSDEIHADLVFPEHRHIALAAIAGDEAHRIITCVAPTKTFNLAGVQAAIMIATDKEVRAKLEQNALAHGQMSLSPFAAAAVKSAYTQGGPWLSELLEIISSNMDYVITELEESLPGIKINKPHGTYLLWIDYRDTGLSEKEMMDKLLTKGRIALEPGSKYGESGIGFLRMNVACPLSTVKDGVQRIITALS